MFALNLEDFKLEKMDDLSNNFDYNFPKYEDFNNNVTNITV